MSKKSHFYAQKSIGPYFEFWIKRFNDLLLQDSWIAVKNISKPKKKILLKEWNFWLCFNWARKAYGTLCFSFDKFVSDCSLSKLAKSISTQCYHHNFFDFLSYILSCVAATSSSCTFDTLENSTLLTNSIFGHRSKLFNLWMRIEKTS